MNEPRAEIVHVTPEMATKWLESNTRNRNPKPANIDKYSRDMRSGAWKLTGEGIKFAPDGTLLDGQNRLMACVKAGASFRTFVFRDVADEAQKVMDTGVARTAADALSIAQEKNTSLLASAAKLAVAMNEDAGNPDSYTPSHAEIEAFVRENPELRKATEFARLVARKTDCPPSVVAYTTWVFMHLDEADAFEFWTAAAEKVGLRAGDPVIALTNRFAEARRNRERMHKRAILSAVFRAWNYRRANKELRLVKLNSPSGGLIPIPEPI